MHTTVQICADSGKKQSHTHTNHTQEARKHTGFIPGCRPGQYREKKDGLFDRVRS